MQYNLEQIIDLAKSVELEDSIDWSETNVDRDKIYQIIGSQVYDLYRQWQNSGNGDAILLATITKLVVENFLLNLKVEGRR